MVFVPVDIFFPMMGFKYFTDFLELAKNSSVGIVKFFLFVREQKR